MKVSELINKLSTVPQDLEIICNVYNHNGDIMVVEVRDFLSDGALRSKQLIIGTGEIGFPELTEEEYEKQRGKLLAELKDPQIIFWENGKYNYGTYTNYGGSQDHCYTTKYDPRIIKRMQDEGVITLGERGTMHTPVTLTMRG